MPLKYILRRTAAETGLNAALENAEQRLLLIDVVNLAAEMIYEETDLPVSWKEICLQVTPDSQIALPQYVGEIRAVRDRKLGRPWTIEDMKPRYSETTWKNEWKTFRHKGYSAIQTTITNAAPIRFIIPVADGSIVTIVGRTALATQKSEQIVMDAVQKDSVESYLEIRGLGKIAANDYDISAYDADSNLLAVIPNNCLESRYIILDVSKYPGGFCGNYTVAEVLYKDRILPFVNDEDQFPVMGYDNIIVTKAAQLLMETEEGKELRAAYFEDKTNKQIVKKVQDKMGDSRPMDIRSSTTYAALDRANWRPIGWRNRRTIYR